jgi:hypothetical protein
MRLRHATPPLRPMLGRLGQGRGDGAVPRTVEIGWRRTSNYAGRGSQREGTRSPSPAVAGGSPRPAGSRTEAARRSPVLHRADPISGRREARGHRRSLLRPARRNRANFRSIVPRDHTGWPSRSVSAHARIVLPLRRRFGRPARWRVTGVEWCLAPMVASTSSEERQRRRQCHPANERR